MGSAGTTKRAPGSRLWRWTWRGVAAAAAVTAALLAGAALLLGHLEHPWLKARLIALVRAQAGADVDYDFARVHLLSGLEVGGLRILSPPQYRATAPELARVGHIEAAWTLPSLLRSGARIERVAVDDLAVTVVEDEAGRTSVDALSRPSQAAAPPSGKAPTLRELASTSLPIGEIDLSRVSLRFIRTGGGRILDRWTLTGLALRLGTRRDGATSLLDLRAGASGSPLELSLSRDGTAVAAGSARLGLWLDAQAGPSGASAVFDLRIREQTLSPEIAVAEVLHLVVQAAFDAPRATTEISVQELRAADAAVNLDAKLALPDAPETPILLRQASGTVNLEPLTKAAPPGLVPLSGTGALTFGARDVELGEKPRILREGSLSAEAALENVRFGLPRGSLSLHSARWTMRVGSGAGGPEGRTSLDLRGLGFKSPGEDARADGIDLTVEGSKGLGGAWTGAARLGVESIEVPGNVALAARGVRATATVKELRLDPASPLSAVGDVAVSADVPALEARGPSGRARAKDVHLGLRLPLTGGAPFAGRGEITAREVRLFDRDERLFASAPARAEVELADAVPGPDGAALALARATLHAVTRAGPLAASLDATCRGEELDFKLGASGQGVNLTPLLSSGQGRDPEDEIDFALTAAGHVDGLSSAQPAVRQQAELEMSGTALRRLDLQRAELALRSSGNYSRHQANVDLRVQPLGSAGPWHAALSADVDSSRPSLTFKLITDGGPSASLAGSAELDRAHRLLRYDLDGHLSHLDPLRRILSRVPGLAGLHPSQLELDLAAHGTAPAFAPGDASDAPPRLPPPSALAESLEGTLEVKGRGLRWQSLDREVLLPSASLHLDLRGAGSRRKLEGTLQVDELQVFSGEQKVDAKGLSVHAATSFGGNLGEDLDLALDLSLGSLVQDYAAYPVGNLALAVSAHRNAEGVIRISELKLENPAAGTSLTLQGGMDLGYLRRRLSVRGQLQQDLARAWSAPETFQGRGRLGVTFRVDSSDLAIYRTLASLRLDGVDARLPRAGVALEAVDGEIPVSADVAVEAHGFTLLRAGESNPFSQHRFADQHPLLSRSSFLYVGSISSPAATISPLAGNLKVEQNVISLDQVEMGYRGGYVSGECVLDWEGDASTLRLHARAAGVRSSHGEPFDGNAALLISASERSIDGRIEILRIGSQHLLDLLDLQDPLRVDPATNRIRFALTFGYPDHARVQFDHGFASMRVAFGGLAQLINVDELRGVPTGPLIDRMLAPFSKRETP